MHYSTVIQHHTVCFSSLYAYIVYQITNLLTTQILKHKFFHTYFWKKSKTIF